MEMLQEFKAKPIGKEKSRNPTKTRKCYCCDNRYRLSDHHLMPRELGGSNEERNLITLCAICHNAVEGEQESLSAGDIWLNVLKRKESFQRESPGRKKYRLSRESAQPCPVYVSEDVRRKAKLNAMVLEDYFAQTDTPAKHSPVGELMIRVLAKFPGISLEDARAKAGELLNCAARGRAFRTPRVLSEQEQGEQRERLKKAFGQVHANA
jgi:hypothetical protein